MLFKRLPDEIFKPLAGPNRYLFEEILHALYRYFSDEELTNQAIFPRRLAVKGEIEELLARKGRLLHLTPEDDSAGESYNDTPPRIADYMYRRLVQTGWLEEEDEGYNTNVLMPPHANLLLEALEGVANAEKKNYGGTVASINLQLGVIANCPGENAYAFVEVVRAAKDFTRHLQNILTGLRGFQEIIAQQRDPRLTMATFFDDFVENLLISDYKSLQGEDNPFRHRHKVHEYLLHIECNEKIMDALGKVYQEDKKLDPEKARERVLGDLRFIARVFKSVDRRLNAIDMYRARLESRVAEMVRYLDKSVPDLSSRALELLETLGQASSHPTPEDLPPLPAPHRWLSLAVVGPRSFRKAQKRRKPQYIELPAKKEISEEAKQLRKLVKQYLDRRSMTPAKITAFIDRQMGEKKTMTAADFKIETIEDLMAFLFTPHMNPSGSPKISGQAQFFIRKTGSMIENEWMEYPDFIIERKES